MQRSGYESPYNVWMYCLWKYYTFHKFLLIVFILLEFEGNPLSYAFTCIMNPALLNNWAIEVGNKSRGKFQLNWMATAASGPKWNYQSAADNCQRNRHGHGDGTRDTRHGYRCGHHTHTLCELQLENVTSHARTLTHALFKQVRP